MGEIGDKTQRLPSPFRAPAKTVADHQRNPRGSRIAIRAVRIVAASSFMLLGIARPVRGDP
jgi:hypothetical protein